MGSKLVFSAQWAPMLISTSISVLNMYFQPDTHEGLSDPCFAAGPTLQTHQFKLPGYSYEHNGKHLKGSIE